jgi:hypothetical protein
MLNQIHVQIRKSEMIRWEIYTVDHTSLIRHSTVRQTKMQGIKQVKCFRSMFVKRVSK